MAITKILNIQESEGRNPASHLKNALEYIQNPDKTEECVLVGSINCLPDTAFEQMEETKNIFHKTGKRQGYHVIISFSPEEKVTAEQAMYVLEHFAKDVLGDDYEAVYAVHTDREHMHGHLIWNSVSMTTGKKYNSPKSNWKNHLQPITNKYCDELGLAIIPEEYSRNPKNISRDKWEKEMSMKEIILRDAKMCAYAAGNVEHFKYLMKSLGYIFKKDAWMEVQAPGFRHYHKLAKLDEMFSEDMLRHGKKPFRQYAGICASGQSVKTTLIRLYSIILQTTLDIAKDPEYEDYIDPCKFLFDMRDYFDMDQYKKNQGEVKCPKCGFPAYPSRFITVCEDGHMDDFPWRWWVHHGETSCKEDMYLKSMGNTSSLAELRVECNCGARRVMSGAMQKEKFAGLCCSGNHPHRPGAKAKICKKSVIPSQRGASNVYFTVTRNAISIPPWTNPINDIMGAQRATIETLVEAMGEEAGLSFAYQKYFGDKYS